MAFVPTVAGSAATATPTTRSPTRFSSPAPPCPPISMGRALSIFQSPMPMAPIIPIMLSAAWSLLSESTRKLALVTTRSPAARPSSTSTSSAKRLPSFTSRGTSCPSPCATNTTCRRPESSTALAGTVRRSPAGTWSSTLPYISGRSCCLPAFASSKRTFAVRVFGSMAGWM